MPTGSFGTPSTPLSKLFTERVVLVERTSDPASPETGAIWFRSDLDSGTDKFGEVRWHDGASTNSVPVFDKGTSGSGVEEVLGIKTTNGIAYVPVALRSDAAYPQLSVQHGGSTYGVHDDRALMTVDDFEDGDIAEYALDTGSFSVQTSTVYNGGNALEGSFAANTARRIVATDFSVSNGNTYRFNQRFPTTDVAGGCAFGVEDESSLDGYYLQLNASVGEFTLAEFAEGSFSALASDGTVTYSTGVWYEVEFDWGSGGSLTATLFDETGTQLSQVTATDSTFTSGGIGWRMFNDTTNSRSVFYDWLREV